MSANGSVTAGGTEIGDSDYLYTRVALSGVALLAVTVTSESLAVFAAGGAVLAVAAAVLFRPSVRSHRAYLPVLLASTTGYGLVYAQYGDLSPVFAVGVLLLVVANLLPDELP